MFTLAEVSSQRKIGTILTSSDGISWTERISGTSEWIVGVTYS